MQIETRNEGNVMVVTLLEKRLDASIAKEFKQNLVTLIENGNKLLALNLSTVNFIDSGGLGSLVSSLTLIVNDGNIVLFGIKQSVMTLFRLTRLNKVFQIFEDERGAIKALLT